MYLNRLRIVGLRSFYDTGFIDLSPTVNLFIGPNNSGKTSIIRALASFQQGVMIDASELRAENEFHGAFTSYADVGNFGPPVPLIAPGWVNSNLGQFATMNYSGGIIPAEIELYSDSFSSRVPIFSNKKPNNVFIPLLSNRRSIPYEFNLNEEMIRKVDGTYQNIIAKIDEMTNRDNIRWHKFQKIVKYFTSINFTTKIVGVRREIGFFLNIAILLI